MIHGGIVRVGFEIDRFEVNSVAWLLLALASFSWVAFDVCRKHLANKYAPLLIGFAFSVITLPVYLGLYLAGSDIPLKGSSANYYFAAVLSGGLAALGAVSFISALAKGRFSILIPVLSITPVVTALLNWLIFSQHLSLLAYCLIAMSCIATYRLLGDGFTISEKGAPQMLLAAFCWGACICVDQYALQFASVSLHALSVNLIMLVLLLTFIKLNKQSLAISGFSWYWVLGGISFCCAVLLLFSALEYIDASIVESVKRAVGVLASLIIGRVFFLEKLSLHQYFYCFIVVAAVLGLGLLN